MARRIGNMHAHEVDSLLLAGDTLGTQDLLIQIASTEAEIRRRGSSSVANSYLESFLNTLDSLQSQLASELSRTSLSN